MSSKGFVRHIPYAIVVTIALSATSTAGAWNFYHGDGGHSGHVEPPQSVGQLSPIWDVEFSNSVQDPMVTAGDAVVILDNDWILSAVDIDTGEILWQNDEIGRASTAGFRNHLVSNDQSIFLIGNIPVENDSGIIQGREHIIAVNAVTGSIEWKKTHDEIADAYGDDWGLVSQFFDIIVDDSGVLYMSLRAGTGDLDDSEFMAALNASDGSLMWAVEADPAASRQNAITQLSLVDDNLYYTSRYRVYTLNTITRDRFLLLDLNDFGYFNLNSRMAIRDGRLYIIAGDSWTTGDYRLFGFDLTEKQVDFFVPIGDDQENESSAISATTHEVFVTTEDARLWAYHATTGEELWNFAPEGRDTVRRSGPIIFSDRLLFASHKHGEDTSAIHCLDLSNGAEIWSHELPARTFSPFTFKNGTLVVGGDRVWGLADEVIFADGFVEAEG
jgi:outer membrane protein assembly factor BamB